MIEINQIYNSDCFELLKQIDDESIDAIICDPPYGTTPCDWDIELPFDKLWIEYRRILKPSGTIVIFCQQPFTTRLIIGNIEMWKYNWIWVKDNSTNFLNSHHQPLKITEDIAVFGFGSTSPSTKGNHMTYNPQMNLNAGKAYKRKCGNRTTTSVLRKINAKNNDEYEEIYGKNQGERFPTNLIYFKRDECKLHPTQKPIDLLRYLVLTHTNKGDLVLDNCMGVGTTIIACIKEKRKYIGIELNKNFFDIAKKRIDNELKTLTLF